MTSHGWNFGVSDIINLPTSQGSGYVLAPDGSGGLTWIATSSIGVTDHGALTGLADDDHTQYILASGTRTGAVSQRQTFTNAVDTSAYYEIGTNKVLHVGGTSNLFAGVSAGASVAAGGTGNVGVGVGALGALTTSDEHVAVGYQALNAVVTGGAGAVAVGYQTLLLATQPNRHVAIGYRALASLAADVNADITAIGPYAMENATGGTIGTSTAIGAYALRAVTGAGNLAVGYQALVSLTSGTSNLAIGYQAMQLATASNNLAIGEAALKSSTGVYNLAIGAFALDANTSGTYNLAIGKDAMGANQTGQNNVAIGLNALTTQTSGNSNLAIGPYAGNGIVNRSENTLIGPYAGDSSDLTGSVCIGNTSGQYVGTKNSNMFIGSFSGKQSTGGQCIYIGQNAGYNGRGDGNVGIGDSALYNMGASAAGPVTAIGRNAGNGYSGGYGSTFVGYYAGQNCTNYAVTGVGQEAAYGNTGLAVVAIGDEAAKNNTQSICLFIGRNTGNASAPHQGIIGGDNAYGYISDFWFGTGRVSASSASRHTSINASGGSGTNIAGSNLTLAGGMGTGSGAGGNLVLSIAPAGSSGSSLNALFSWLSIASTKTATLGEAANIATGTTTGSMLATATNQKLGVWGATPVVQPSAYTQTYSTADKTLAAYTADTESSAYTGIDNAQGGTPYAQLTDLNALRVAYENLRAFAEDLAQFVNSLVDDAQTIGLVG